MGKDTCFFILWFEDERGGFGCYGWSSWRIEGGKKGGGRERVRASRLGGLGKDATESEKHAFWR
jgi:hypothetical protein